MRSTSWAGWPKVDLRLAPAGARPIGQAALLCRIAGLLPSLVEVHLAGDAPTAAEQTLLGRLCDLGLVTVCRLRRLRDLPRIDARVVRVARLDIPDGAPCPQPPPAGWAAVAAGDEICLEVVVARHYLWLRHLLSAHPPPAGAIVWLAGRAGERLAPALAARLTHDRLHARVALAAHR